MRAAIRSISLAVAFAAAFAAARPCAAAESLLLVCQPRTARGEAAGLWIQEYDPSAGGTPEARIQLPGQSLRQPIQLLLGQRYGVAIVQGGPHAGQRGAAGMWQEMVLVGTQPLRLWPVSRKAEWEPVQILCGPENGSDQQSLAIVERRRDVQTPSGRVRIVVLNAGPEGIRWEARGQWMTPGAPVSAAVDWTQGQLYVLCEGEKGGAAQLAAIKMKDGVSRSMALAGSTEATMHARPAAIALDGDGAQLCVLTSAYSLSRSDGGRMSTIQWVDAATFDPIGGAQEVAGAGEQNSPVMIAREDGDVWARTYDDATGFAYATAVTTRNGQHEKRREEAFRAAAGAPRLAMSRDGARVALAGGRGLRIVAAAGGDAIVRTFSQPVESVAWGESGLYVGEGSQIHSVDPQTAESMSVGGAAEGFIVGMCALSSKSRSAPDVIAPNGFLPPRIELDAVTPGRDVRVVPIDLAAGETVRIARSERNADWLRAELAEPDHGTARLTLALDRQALPARDGEWFTNIEVYIESKGAAPRAASIEIEASSVGATRRVIEWQSGKDDPAYDALTAALAGPPLHLSRRERRGPFSRPPRGSAAAVVRLEDVARGAITRQVLLDYVSGGGGLLVIAGHTPKPGGEGLRRWLEPLGLLIEPGEDVSGRYPVSPNKLVNFGLDQLSIAAGAYVEVTRPMDVSVPGPASGTAVVALTRYGYGRLGVIASDTPLSDRAMAQASNRRFARALFGWLAGENTAVADSDQDGLRDDVEDANRNGIVERGETDWLREDSDGDGVPDGEEDSNLNGIVDEGETDPRRRDTDGDGIADGADPEPLPSSGSPVILAVQPATAPAQGGTLLEIAGRNFPANPQVWFGEQRATHVVRLDSTRLVATPPPRAYGMAEGPMPVRVAHPLGVAENTLERAFTYSAPTPVRFTLEAIDRVRRAYDGYRGTMSLTLDLADVQIDYGAFYLRTTPQMAGLSVTFERGRGLIAVGREATFRSNGPGQFWTLLAPGEPLTGRVELGTLTWHLADPAPAFTKFQWNVIFPDLRVLWGGNASVPPNERWTDLDSAERDPTPPAGAPAPP